MKITLFTNNQPRHINLINKLSKISKYIFCIQECNTVFPGEINDFFKNSKVMKTYFDEVRASERKIFGELKFTNNNVSTLSIKNGDLSKLNKTQLKDALSSDVYIVFGASYIKGWLIDFLVSKNALNIHMGLSPYYRGSSCNFWALYDYNPSYVGATIHKLSKGLDSGPILFHCLPKLIEKDTSFDFTMRSVETAHNALYNRLKDNSIFNIKETQQDKTLELRYSKNSDFNDLIAEKYLERKTNIHKIKFNYPNLKDPFIG